MRCAHSACSILTRDHKILRQLLIEAKQLFHKASENMISIYVSDPYVPSQITHRAMT